MTPRPSHGLLVPALLAATALGCNDNGHVAPGRLSEGAAEGAASGVADEIPGRLEPEPEPAPVETDPARPGFYVLPETCAAPAGLGWDPLAVTGRDRATAPAPHLLDAILDPARKLLFATGLPSLYVYDVAGSEPIELSHFPDNGLLDPEKFEHAERVDGYVLALTYGGLSFGELFPVTAPIPGLTLVDVADPYAPELLGFAAAPGLGPMGAQGDRLHVGTHGGKLHTWDVSDPTAPKKIATAGGLKSPREIEVAGKHAYVADAILGLVVLDLTNEDRPVVVQAIPTSGPAMDVAVDGDLLVVAAGAAGLEAFSLGNPANPKPLGPTPLFGSAVSVDVFGDRVWAATYGEIVALDRNGTHPLVMAGREPATSAALAVAAHENRAFACDWEFLDVLERNPAWKVAQSRLLEDEVYLSGPGEVSVDVANVGSEPLYLTGLVTGDPRVEARVDRLSVPTGETARILLRFEGPGEPPDTEVCLATNDPDRPVKTFRLAPASSWPGPLQVGDVAPEFVLPDLDGGVHALSDYSGRPVVLASFATWCPICTPIMTDLEASVWKTYEDAGVVVLGLGGNEEGVKTLDQFRKQLGLTFPILFDATGEVVETWTVKSLFQILPYPQDFVVAPDGTIAYADDQWDPGALTAALDQLLAEAE